MHTNNVSYVTVHNLLKSQFFLQQHAAQCTTDPIMAVPPFRVENTINCILTPGSLGCCDFAAHRTTPLYFCSEE